MLAPEIGQVRLVWFADFIKQITGHGWKPNPRLHCRRLGTQITYATSLHEVHSWSWYLVSFFFLSKIVEPCSPGLRWSRWWWGRFNCFLAAVVVARLRQNRVPNLRMTLLAHIRIVWSLSSMHKKDLQGFGWTSGSQIVWSQAFPRTEILKLEILSYFPITTSFF